MQNPGRAASPQEYLGSDGCGTESAVKQYRRKTRQVARLKAPPKGR
ncbi:MAG: hypothetical protein WAV05_07025 [Anaerolineales bacterium]